MIDRVTLGSLCLPAIGQIKEEPETIIDYIDISSVSNETKSITGYISLPFSEAPSRARKSLRKGSILVSTVRPNLNAVAVLDSETPNKPVASTGFCVLDCRNNVDQSFVFNFCKSKAFIDQMTKQATGASYPAVSDKIVRAAILPTYSYEKQKEIGNILDKISALINMRKQELKRLDELIKARFVEMFGDPIRNERGWTILPVQNICKEIFGGGTPSKSHPEYYENGNIPWVSSKDMKYDVITDSQIHINQSGVDNSTARMVPVNSVIMVIRSGILKHTLPVAINAVPITVNQDLKVFIPNEKVLTRFMAVQFKMQENDILSGVRAVTADNIEFNSIKQRNMIVPPIGYQKEYVSFLEQVDKSKANVQAALDKAQLLFDSLMQQYFG